MNKPQSPLLYRKFSIIRLGLLVWTGWLVLLASSLAWNLVEARKTINVLAEIEAETHFNKDTVYRRWAALQGGVYVPISSHTPPNPLLAHLKERDVVTQSGRRLTLVNPAYMTRQVHELSQDQYGVRGHITSLKPVRAETEPDTWERAALLEFEKGVSAVKSLTMIDGKPFLRFMRPFMAEEGCLKCHGYQGYKEGDVRGGVSVSVPLEHYYELLHKEDSNLIFWHLLILIVGSSGLLIGCRRLHRINRENQQAWQLITIDRDRFAALLELSQMRQKSEEGLIRFALEKYVKLTGSEVGYFHFYDEKSQIIKLFAWSEKVMAQCQVSALAKSYALADAGVWADSIRQRQPVFHNDYQSGVQIKGLPEGHFPISRHLSVPVIDGKQVVGIAGVCNKGDNYNNEDVAQLLLFSNTMWEIIKNTRAIDEIKEKEETLQVFRRLIDQSYDAIFIISPEDGSLLDINGRSSELLGYTRAELLQLKVPDIDAGLSTAVDFSWEQHLKEVRSSPALMFETVHIRKDGTTFPVEINVKSVVLEEDHEYLVAAARDISKRKFDQQELERHRQHLEQLVSERTGQLAAKTEDLEKTQQALVNLLEDVNGINAELEISNQKLAELDRLKSMFIASMSHELRTPLNAIIGFSAILEDEWLGPLNDEQKTNQRAILLAGKHLLALINDIIDLSKIEAGKLAVELKTFNLGPLIDESVALLRQAAQEKGLDLKIKVVDCELKTDRKRLLQVLVNLLSNAIKFTSRGGIVIRACSFAKGPEKAAVEVVEISVSDTGIGISEADLKKLFQPFVRLHAAGDTRYPGTGLGLYLTAKLIREILGGEIRVVSNAGVGSTFTISIPRHHGRSESL